MLSRTLSGDAMIAILGTPQTLARRNTKARSAAPNHVGARVEPGDRNQQSKRSISSPAVACKFRRMLGL